MHYIATYKTFKYKTERGKGDLKLPSKRGGGMGQQDLKQGLKEKKQLFIYLGVYI